MKVLERLSDGLVILASPRGPQMWSRAASRKAGICRETARAYAVGDLVYRPITNSALRSQRIVASAVDASEALAITRAKQDGAGHKCSSPPSMKSTT